MKTCIFVITLGAQLLLISARRIPYAVVFRLPIQKCKTFDLEWNIDPEKQSFAVNPNGTLDGKIIYISFRPGEWPYFDYLPNGTVVTVNDGLPQSADLEAHLRWLSRNYRTYEWNDGIGYSVISFHKWRPVWRQNYRWDRLIYQTASTLKLLQSGLTSNLTRIRSLAEHEFELHAAAFFTNTLKKIKQLPDNDPRIGFMGYPNCFISIATNSSECSYRSVLDDNLMNEIYFEMNTFYPTIFLPDPATYRAGSEATRDNYVRTKVASARKLAKELSPKAEVVPIVTYVYSGTERMMTKEDLIRVFRVPCEAGAAAVIFYGKSALLDSEQECKTFHQYYDDYVVNAAEYAANCAKRMDDPPL